MMEQSDAILNEVIHQRNEALNRCALLVAEIVKLKKELLENKPIKQKRKNEQKN